jgi:hypothetical protein
MAQSDGNQCVRMDGQQSVQDKKYLQTNTTKQKNTQENSRGNTSEEVISINLFALNLWQKIKRDRWHNSRANMPY